MPLTKPQLDFIDATLGHFFYDLPKDGDGFQAILTHFKRALLQTLPEDDEYITLQRCFDKPHLYIQRLETFNAVTQYEVREGIFNYITEKLKEMASGLKINFDDGQWLTMASFQKNEEEEKTMFTSASSSYIPDDHPYTIENSPEKSYSATLIPNPDFLAIHIDLTLHLEEKKVSQVEFKDYPEDPFEDDNAEYEHMLSLMPEAKEKAEVAAINAIFKHLNETDAYKAHETHGLRMEVKKLATYKYYYELFRESKISIRAIKDLSSAQVDGLCQRNMISLINQKVISFHNAAHLDPNILHILRHKFYYDLLSHGELKLSDLKIVNRPLSKNLILPQVVRLIENRILPFSQTNKLTQQAFSLMKTEFYFDQLKKRKISYVEIALIDRKQRRVLTEPAIERLIGAGVLTIGRAKNIRRYSEHFNILKGKNVCQLLISKKMDYIHATWLTKAMAKDIEKDDTIVNLSKEEVHKKLITFGVPMWQVVNRPPTLFFRQAPSTVSSPSKMEVEHKSPEHRASPSQ